MNPLLLLDSSKNTIKAMSKDQNINILNEEKSDIDFKDFLSILLDSNTQTDKNILSLKSDDKKNTLDIDILDVKKSSKNAKDLSLDELLNFVTLLKSNGLQGNFPTDKEKINNILNSEQAIKDFKNVKSIKDILKVAKKYDIKIENFEISQKDDDLIDLQDKSKSIPMQKTSTKEKINKQIQTKLQNNIVSNLNKTDKKIITKDSKSLKSSPLEHLIQTKKSDPKDLSNSKKITIENEKIQIKNSNKNKQQDVQLSKNSINKQQDINKVKNKHSAVQTNQEIPIEINEKNQQKSINIQQVNIKAKDKKDKKTGKFDSKEKKITIADETKNVSKTDSSEIFNKLKSFTKDNKTIHKMQTVEKTILHKTQSKTEHIVTEDNSSSNKENNIFTKNDISIQHTANTHHAENKVISSKQTINQFANDLQEQIKNYKPPIMKVKMTLSPKDLGAVDVSMINRGNSLQVTISSNTNTMAIFTQNQAEFKNSLVNMGFTNLNMNFNSNGNGSNKNSNDSNKNTKSYKEQSEQESENTDFIDITIPRYI